MIYYSNNYHHIVKPDLILIWENKGLAGSFLKQYGYFLPVLLLVTFVCYRIVPGCINRNQVWEKKESGSVLLIYCLILSTGLVAGIEKRGSGFLTPASVFRFSDPQWSSVTINSTYLLLHSLFSDDKVEVILNKTYATDKGLIGRYSAEKKLSDASPYNGYLKGKNIFLFVIESASRELFMDSFSARPSMPFLDSLKKESLFFSNAFANGGNSPEGINAIIGGIPNLLSRSFNKTVYSYNTSEYIGHKLTGMGYHSYFFYGADKNGTGFSKLSELYGINDYLSVDDFKGLAENEKSWGVQDHIFFPAVAEKMKDVPTPFFSVLFNISTHGPFNLLPDSLLKMKREKNLDLAQAYEYYDNVLRSFFKTISKYDWYKNTQFVFVADHFSRSREQKDKSSVGIFRIPLMIYSPEKLFKGEYSKPVQQVDLPVTFLNLLGYQGGFYSFGTNIFDTSINNRFAINRVRDYVQIMDDSLALSYNFETNTVQGLWNYKNDILLEKDLSGMHKQQKEILLQQIKYYLESFKNHLLKKKVQH